MSEDIQRMKKIRTWFLEAIAFGAFEYVILLLMAPVFPWFAPVLGGIVFATLGIVLPLLFDKDDDHEDQD